MSESLSFHPLHPPAPSSRALAGGTQLPPPSCSRRAHRPEVLEKRDTSAKWAVTAAPAAPQQKRSSFASAGHLSSMRPAAGADAGAPPIIAATIRGSRDTQSSRPPPRRSRRGAASPAPATPPPMRPAAGKARHRRGLARLEMAVLGKSSGRFWLGKLLVLARAKDFGAGERASMLDPATVAWRRRRGTARRLSVCRRLENGTKPSAGEATRDPSVRRCIKLK